MCEAPEPLLSFQLTGAQATVNSSSEKHMEQYHEISFFYIQVSLFFLPKSEDLPASLKHSAFQCCRRLPKGIVPDLKLGKQDEREGITEVSPWHEEV